MDYENDEYAAALEADPVTYVHSAAAAAATQAAQQTAQQMSTAWAQHFAPSIKQAIDTAFQDRQYQDNSAGVLEAMHEMYGDDFRKDQAAFAAFCQANSGMLPDSDLRTADSTLDATSKAYWAFRSIREQELADQREARDGAYWDKVRGSGYTSYADEAGRRPSYADVAEDTLSVLQKPMGPSAW